MIREIKITLEGEPIAKQSTTVGKSRRTGKVVCYSKDTHKFKESQYRNQIKKQLPKSFEMFENSVTVKEIVFIFAPTKAMLKHKKKRAWLDCGGLIEKSTKPDLHDNLNKLPFDSMELKKGYKTAVFKNDSIIQRVESSAKYYGLNPRIEITLVGY